MALEIEDGTSKVDAESFATVAETQAFAEARGFTTLPADEAAIEALLRKAADFLCCLPFQGAKTSRLQALPFPRSGMDVEDEEVPDDEIPAEVKKAQMQLAMEAVTTELMPTGVGREIAEEQVDVIVTKYFQSGKSAGQPVFYQALAWLDPYLSGTTGLAGINAKILRR